MIENSEINIPHRSKDVPGLEQLNPAKVNKENPLSRRVREAKPAGGAGGDDEIEKAKELVHNIEEEGKQNEPGETIRRLRKDHLTTAPIDASKQQLEKNKKAPTIKWLTDNLNISDLTNADVVEFYERVANSGENQKNPDWLTAETLRLVYKSAKNPDANQRLEVAKVVRTVRTKIEELSRKTTTDITVEKFDTLFYGGTLERNPTFSVTEDGKIDVIQMYDEEHPENDSIIDPQFIKYLRDELNDRFRVDKNFQNDTVELGKKTAGINSETKRKEFSDAERSEMNDRFRSVRDHAERVRQGPSREWRPYISTLGLSEADQDTVMRTADGYRVVLTRLLTHVDADPHAEWKEAAGAIQYKVEQIKELVERRYAREQYGPEGKRHAASIIKEITAEIGAREAMHELARIMSEGKFEDILKVMPKAGPEELDHILHHSSEFTPQAVSAMDMALRNMIAEARQRYMELNTLVQQQYDRMRPADFGGRKNDNDFTQLDKAAKIVFKNNPEELETWRRGVNLKPEDFEVSTEYKRAVERQKGLTFFEMQQKVARGEQLTPNEREIWEDSKTREQYEKYFQYEKNWLESRGFTGDEMVAEMQRMADADREVLENGMLTPIDKKALEILQNYLDIRGVSYDKETLSQSVINARNFEIISFHMQSVMANLCDLPPGNNMTGGANPEWWVATPFEDTLRALNTYRWLEHRYRMGTGSSDAFRILRQGYEPEIERFDPGKNTAIYRKGHRLMSNESAERLSAFADLKMKSGINFEELAVEAQYAIGGELDSTGWRAFVAIMQHQEDEMHALGYQFQVAEVGSAHRKNIARRMFERTPLLAFHFVPTMVSEILGTKGVDEGQRGAVMQRLREALSVWELEVTYDKKFNGNKHDVDGTKTLFGVETHQGKEVGLLHGLPGGQSVASQEMMIQALRSVGVVESEIPLYQGYIAEIVKKTTEEQFLTQFSNIKIAFTPTASDIDWDKTHFSDLGSIERNRRQRDITGKMSATEGETALARDPSPLNQEDVFKNLKKIQEGMGAYLGPEDPKTNERIYSNIYAYLEWNRNQLEWIPGWTTISKLIPTSWNIHEGPTFERVIRWIFPHASYAQSRKGSHAPAMDTIARDYFIDECQRWELLTNTRLYDKLKRVQMTHLGWKTAHYLKWVIPLVIGTVSYSAVQDSIKEEKKK